MTVTSKAGRLPDCHANLSEPRTTSPTSIASKRSNPGQTLARSSHRDATRNLLVQRRSSWTTNDISAFGLTLTLVLLGTFLAAHTHRPVFWLLLGPGPLAVGFTVITFLRQGFGGHHLLSTIAKRNRRSSSGLKGFRIRWMWNHA
jgi:hypothetical protein